MKGHEHKYIEGITRDEDECEFCGLLKSTIEQVERKTQEKITECDHKHFSWMCNSCGVEMHIAEKEKIKNDLLDIADRGEYEDMRREIANYFNPPRRS